MKRKFIVLALAVLALLLVSCATGSESSYYREDGVINIKKITVDKPNIVDGVDMRIYWQNLSGKEIKYIYFDVQAFNAVNDPVKCEIRGSSVRTNMYVTGPVPANFNSHHYWEAVWYNSSIKRAEILNVRIEYMDGTTKSIALNPAVY